MYLQTLVSFFLFLVTAGCFAAQVDIQAPHPIYIGVLGGYGSTTWAGLVPRQENINIATNLSTPIKVEEGGGVWGLLAGYEFIPNFALELSYIQYPTANVLFDDVSLFAFDNDGLTNFDTHTETINLMGKFMFYLPRTSVRVFSSAGVASIHRNDLLLNEWRYDPTFGVGLNYHFTERLMAELAGNYTAGFGEAQLNPTNTYFPFLYSVSLRLAYCFGA